MMRWLAIASIALTSGCALAEAVQPDPKVDDDQMKEIESAVSLGVLPASSAPGDRLVVLSAPPTTNPPQEETPQSPDEAFDGAYFATNSASLSEEGLAACDNAAERLRQRTTGGHLVFLGFADVRPASYPGGNLQLSKDRAGTVASCIAVGLGGDDRYSILAVDGLGEACPRHPDPEDASNRRVEIFVMREPKLPVSEAC